MSVKKIELKNNIVLITQDLDTCDVCSIGFFFSTGSRYESKGEYGITHFTEHMLFKGTTSRTNRDISCIFDRMGGIFNAYTERENVTVYCTLPSHKKENFELALDTLCDITENCSFPKEEFEKEKEVVKNEILSVEDDFDESAIDEVARTIWPGNNLSLTITGTESDVEAISIPQMKKWYDNFFSTGELVVVVTGKFYEEELIERLNRMNNHKQVQEFYKFNHFADKPEWQKGLFFKSAGFNQCQIFMLYPLEPEMNFENYCALQIFNSIVGDSITSRLFEALREKSGLCYNTGSFYTTYENAGTFSSFVVCDKKNLSKTMETMQNELKILSEKGISEEEMNIAVERWCGNEILGNESSAYIMRRLWNLFSMGFDLMDTEEISEYARKLDKEKVESYIRHVLNEEKRTTVVYGPRIPLKIKTQAGKICQKK